MMIRNSLTNLFATLLVLSPALTGVANAGSLPTCAKAENPNGWYAVGSSLASAGHANLAMISLDRAVRDSVSKTINSETYAAIECLTGVQSAGALGDLPNYDSSMPALVAKARGSKDLQSILAQFAFRSVLARIGAKQDVSALLPALAGSSYSAPANGLVAASRSDWKAAKATLAGIVSSSFASKDGALAAAMPAIRLAYARSLYALGEDAAAIAEYEKLFRIGLPMQDALIESAWAQLRSKNYMKSIGLSYELMTGKLAQFFAPEASSIRAISFVENCRYSESRKLIDRFSATYAPVAQWLKASESSEHSLYETALARSEGSIGNEAVPEKVWSVWTGSDFFVSTQKAIRLSFEESRSAAEWIADNGGTAQTKAALAADLKRVDTLRASAAALIESHLAGLNRSMSARIATESARMKMVKIEANQGAGRDLVYRNANPGMADVEKKLLKSERKAKSYSGKLAWGSVKAEDPAAELWIDEIGSFEATALDRCKVKAAYKGLQASR